MAAYADCAAPPVVREGRSLVRSFEFGRHRLDDAVPSRWLFGCDLALLAVLEGAVVVDAGIRPVRVEARRCTLFASEGSVQMHREGQAAAVVLCLGARGGEPGSPGVRIDDAGHAQVLLSEHIETLLGLGSGLVAARTGCDDRLRDALGAAALSAFEAQAESDAVPSTPLHVHKVRDHVDRFFSKKCDLATLAALAGVTREHLNASFRRHVGQTPMRYLWAVRRRHAVRLVETTDMDLATVAERCGYKTPFHLSREVKRLTGRSPREMRRAVAGATRVL